MHQSDHFELQNKKILGKGHSHISKPLRIGKQDTPPQTSPSATTLAALSDIVFAVFASLYEHNQPATLQFSCGALEHYIKHHPCRTFDHMFNGV